MDQYVYTHAAAPVISGFTIFSHEEAPEKEKVFHLEKLTVNVKQVKVLDVSQNQSLLLSFLNNGLQNLMGRLGYAQIGKSGKYFNRRDRQQVDNLFIYSGYKANFVHLESGYYLRVDSAKKVVRNETVLNFIDGFYKLHGSRSTEQKRQLLQAELINKVVMTNYGKTQYYRVVGVQFKQGRDIVINENLDMVGYYREKYNISIRTPNQPLLEVQGRRKENKDKGPILLFPELCLMTGIPENFDEQRRKKISESSIRNPQDKMGEIQALMNELKESQEVRALSELGLTVKEKLCKFKAKTMAVPRLQLGKENQVQSGKQANFNLFNKPIYNCKHSVNCAILHFKGAELNVLLSTFESTSRNLGVKLERQLQELQGRGARDIETALKGLPEHINICLIVLPNSLKNDYKRIKLVAVKNLMPTQVITQTSLRKKNLQSIATKVLLQIIAKRGNTLWVPKTARELSGCMLVGFDSAKSKNCTILASTATINSTFSSLNSNTKSYSKPEEKFQTMKELSLASINAYNSRNEAPPAEVVLFFNACSGDQISLYHELCFKPLMLELEEIYQKGKPAITAIMVNVKNSERFFINEGGFRNVPAGTLVNKTMVSQNYDFFLVSQQSNRGSTVPNHYRVIFCDSKMEEGMLQELIFSQCFNYVNWTGSIKVPAVLQYAKKCAKFVAEVMETEEVPKDMRGKPYFV